MQPENSKDEGKTELWYHAKKMFLLGVIKQELQVHLWRDRFGRVVSKGKKYQMSEP